ATLPRRSPAPSTPPPRSNRATTSASKSSGTGTTSPPTTPPSNCSGWPSATSRTNEPAPEPKKKANPATNASHHHDSSKAASSKAGAKPSAPSPWPTPTASPPTSTNQPQIDLHRSLDTSRTIATTPGARWWYVLANPDGSPAAIGRIRTRPNPATVLQDADVDTVTGMPRRGRRPLEVWLQVTHDTLAELAAQPPPGWQPVLDEITTALATKPGGPPNGNPTARLPGAALRRWLH